ncbi:MAG: DEAD/DEAH box helicase family protein [Prolixibacteraceae bacterium]|nr:DEAD/DEAH box helicase family protein [Prolixibacteraceae bacterium]
MKQIDKLILCSPYKEPHVHWKYELATQEFFQAEGRRPAGYTIASSQNIGEFIELPLVNIIRRRLKEWKENNRPGLTGITRDLLEYWEDGNRRTYPLFFCQLEAIETIIFLNEAPDHFKTGISIPKDGGDFGRWCCKMATGSGKTIVMAMLIAYNILNKVSYKQDNRFSKNILVVSPGLTVKSRLAVLYPPDENNYYNEFNIVPPTLMDKLRQGQILVINWHMLAWDTQERLNEKAQKRQLRSVDKRRYMEVSDSTYAKMVLGELAKSNNILVINDEAHHAWRTAAESKEKQVKREDIDNTVWVGGLDKLHRQVKILRCHDFSATPFAPTGKRTSELGLYEWIISDFGLNDAIESGLVKTPRVVFRDDGKYTSDYKSRLYHIYNDDEVREDLNQKQVVKETPIPDLVKNAYNLLGSDWLKTKQEWIRRGIKIPPAMITIANTTATSERIKFYFDSSECEVKELCDIDKTLQIDSEILNQIENEDENLSGSKKLLAEQLREKVDTVGKVGQPGEQIQNVISVSMLSEGWDAKNVTQIMGLRAFSSQLLCEQVIGRGLRRISYEFDENQMLEPEYVNVFGVPFSFIPHEGGVSVPRPPKPKYQIEPINEKLNFEIKFPNILRVDTVYKSSLSIDYNEIKPIVIDPNDSITVAELAGVIQNNVVPAALTDIDLKEYSERFRLQSVIFRVATNIYSREKPNWKGNEYDFLAQLLKLTEEFISSNKLLIKTDLFNRDNVRKNILLTLNISRIIQHFWVAIKDQNAAVLTPVFDNEKPIRSTSDMPTWYTSKPNEWHKKCHINFTVFDSTWEANNANIIDKHEAVRAFVKNDHLGFIIKYHYKGLIRNYIPDYLIELKNGDKLILEVKGQDNDENRVKREFLNFWVRAVNTTTRFGKWHWAVVFNSSEIYDILEKYREFPAEAYLPQKENVQPEELELRRNDLSTFYDITVEDLRKAGTLEGMITIVAKELLKNNIKNITHSIQSALEGNSEVFVDEEEIQQKIYNHLDGITPTDNNIFDARVRGYIKDAPKLERQSFSFLISAEYIHDTLVKQFSEDYSPYVLQLSRSVESELLFKAFVPFINYIRNINPNCDKDYEEDQNHPATRLFAQAVINNRHSISLGSMYFILNNLNDGTLLERSRLISDFHLYVIDNFSPDLYNTEFLAELNELLNKFRNKSAHISTISRDKASDCKFLVRKILARFLNLI